MEIIKSGCVPTARLSSCHDALKMALLLWNVSPAARGCSATIASLILGPDFPLAFQAARSREKKKEDISFIFMLIINKFDEAIKQYEQVGSLRKQELATSKSSSDNHSSDYDDAQAMSGKDSIPFTSLDEYRFLQRNQTARAGHQEEEEETAKENKDT
ncbi:hypothetical protein NDU88_004345 [Pleurodeles waltl]|uniref:Uncharacterized protein n=1 Tax=Pleurodeles waltl TaxID=8319 RepID=A0AAV7T842_PLEWA|nr:hypothetical protein NDU88_004345 [Pleurodeles waltl]